MFSELSRQMRKKQIVQLNFNNEPNPIIFGNIAFFYFYRCFDVSFWRFLEFQANTINKSSN